MNKNNRIQTFDNGLVLLGEEMNWCESISVALRLPCGAADDPADRLGLAGMTCEMAGRGAGTLGNQEYLSALENLGIGSYEDAGQRRTVFCHAMVADKLEMAMPLFADLVRRPLFPESELESSRNTLLQEVIGLEDEPSSKLLVELEQTFFPEPWGRRSCGTAEGLNAITLSDIHRYFEEQWQPEGAIMGIAGRFDWDAACQLIGSQFEDWTPKHRPQIVEVPRTKFVRHIPFDSTQTHIGLACPAPNFRSPEFLLIQGAVSALSGGVSSRLFTEVREKRGLCYTVSASLISKGCRGALFCYCGTSSERAQESLDVILLELRRLTDEGVTEDELAKMKIRLKSGLVLQQESSGSRCHSIVSDWHRFGRIRSMAELEQRIDDLTREQINTYLKAHPFGPFRMVTLGPGPLSIAPELVG